MGLGIGIFGKPLAICSLPPRISRFENDLGLVEESLKISTEQSSVSGDGIS